jgi:hypothetical protein
MPQDAILGPARPRTMSRMYGSAAAAVSALLRTVTAAFTVRPSRCRRHGQQAAARAGEGWPLVTGRGDGPPRVRLGAGDQLLRGDAAHPLVQPSPQAAGGATAAADGWEAPADSGWDAARTVLAPASSGVTTAGLPVRAPRANLMPGAIGSPRPDDSGPVRPADVARNRLAGFQRGASRGRAASSHDGQDPAP